MGQIKHFYQHIDNGGISVDVVRDPRDGYLELHLTTSYFGYPDITSILRTWGLLDEVSFLRGLGTTLIEAAAKVEAEEEALRKLGSEGQGEL